MKAFYKLCFLLGFIVISSCGTDDDSPPVENNRFVMNYNDVHIDIEANPAYLFDGGPNTYYDQELGIFYVALHTVDEIFFRFSFDRNGELVNMEYIYSINNNYVYYKPYQYFRSHYFTFNVTEINNTTKRVKGNFSGRLLLDVRDLNSSFVDVDGEFDLGSDFDLNYICSCQGVDQGYGLTANINNELFKSLPVEEGEGVFINNGPYQFRVIIPFYGIEVNHPYAFASASSGPAVKMYKFNTSTLQYDHLDTTGTITVTSYLASCCNSKIPKVTFNLTAVNPTNPDEILQVTDGKAKYSQYDW